jgi:hypothetical protein
MVSIMNFGKPCNEAITRGWEHSIWEFENVFGNLGIVPYSNEMFSEMWFCKMEEKGDGGFKKKALCISVHPTNFSRVTTLPWSGMGRSGVVCSLWHGASKFIGSPTMDTFFVAP